MKWQVQTTRDQFQSVTADALDAQAGCLVFYQDHIPVLIMSPGEWITVHLDEAAEAALKREQDSLSFYADHMDPEEEIDDYAYGPEDVERNHVERIVRLARKTRWGIGAMKR